MPIDRSDILYPINSTTVDSGAGIDIRLLSNAEGGATDTSQTANFSHTNDNVERTFDPATGGVTNTNNAGTTLFTLGWALRLAEDMTPVDDTDCNAILTAGTLVVSLSVNATQTGGTYATGTFGPTFRASLWRYNLSANTGTLIAAGSTTGVTWICGGLGADLGTVKTASISIDVASSVEFAAGEILFLQVGFNTGTVPNPTLGTAAFVVTLQVDISTTSIDFASGQSVKQACVFSNDLVGKGTVTKGVQDIAISRSLIGKGTATNSRAVVAAKSFDLIGKGTVTELHPVQAFRSFNLVGVGTILTAGANASTITLPIDEVPEGGGGTTTQIFAVLD